MDLPNSKMSPCSNARFEIDLTFTVTAKIYLTMSEYATLQPSVALDVAIVNLSFNMLQEKFKTCLFFIHELANEIVSQSGTPILETINIFSKKLIFFPFNSDNGWNLVSVDMRKKSLTILGFRGSDHDNSKDLTENILKWFARSSRETKFIYEEWTFVNMTQAMPVSGTVDSGVYLLMCAYFLASNGNYILYEPNDVANFRRNLRANLKNSLFPPLPNATITQLTEGNGHENAASALMDLKQPKL